MRILSWLTARGDGNYRSRAVILAPQSANVRFSLYAPGSGQSKIRQSQWLDATFPIGIVNLPF